MFGPKHTLKSTMQELEKGLRDGTIRLAQTTSVRGEDTDRRPVASDRPLLTWLPMATLAKGAYQVYVGDPVARQAGWQQKGGTSGSVRHARTLVAAGSPREEMLGDALLQ